MLTRHGQALVVEELIQGAHRDVLRGGPPVLEVMFPRLQIMLCVSPGAANPVAGAARGLAHHDESRWAVGRLVREQMPGQPGPWCSP